MLLVAGQSFSGLTISQVKSGRGVNSIPICLTNPDHCCACRPCEGVEPAGRRVREADHPQGIVWRLSAHGACAAPARPAPAPPQGPAACTRPQRLGPPGHPVLRLALPVVLCHHRDLVSIRGCATLSGASEFGSLPFFLRGVSE
jgi:hypothetical protein